MILTSKLHRLGKCTGRTCLRIFHTRLRPHKERTATNELMNQFHQAWCFQKKYYLCHIQPYKLPLLCSH